MGNQELIDSIADMREEEALAIVDRLLQEGADPLDVIAACGSAMDIIGSRFEKGEAFIPELIMAGEMMRQVSETVKPLIKGETESLKKGKVMIGTVHGDIHDIGKDIVVFMLDVNGFEVIDLGVDVPVDTFVEKIREFRPPVLGMSGLLTLAVDAMKETIDAIEAAGLRQGLKIMIGGAAVDELIKNHTKADAWGKDAVQAVSLSKQWIGGQ